MFRLLKRQSISSSLAAVMTMTVAQRVLSVVRQVVFTRMLGPANLGALGLAVDTIVGTPLNFVTLGLPSSYTRYVQQYERKGRLRDFFFRTIRLSLGLAVLAALACMALAPQLSSLVFRGREHVWLVVVAALIIVPESMQRHVRAGFAGMRMFFVTSAMDFFPVLVFTVVGVAFVLLIARNAVAAAAAQATGSWLTLAVFGGLLWRHLKSVEPVRQRIDEPDFTFKILKFSSWYILVPVEMQVLLLVDRWMLVRMRGLHDVGIYTAASSVSAYVFLLGALTANVLGPNLSQMWEEGDRELVMRRINLALRVTLLALLGVALFLLGVSPWVIPLMCGKAFAQSASLMWAFGVYHLFYSAFYVLGLYPMLVERPHMNLIAVSVALAVDVPLNLLLIPRYGVYGAAVAGFTSMGTIVLVLLLQCLRAGLKVQPRTYLVLVLQLLPTLRSRRLLLAVYAALVLVVVLTPWVLTREEKALLTGQATAFLRRRRL
ncbi:MAG TPA: oligosaccharide flippase family protein [Candidatus Saccharimonadales bacterium]|nr:oligosaccharide flippase family protein [Candidatus Saccharimonadales bacterium]